jgi:hypothetical protein
MLRACESIPQTLDHRFSVAASGVWVAAVTTSRLAGADLLGAPFLPGRASPPACEA